jgi:hypothetical protein
MLYLKCPLFSVFSVFFPVGSDDVEMTSSLPLKCGRDKRKHSDGSHYDTLSCGSSLIKGPCQKIQKTVTDRSEHNSDDSNSSIGSSGSK